MDGEGPTTTSDELLTRELVLLNAAVATLFTVALVAGEVTGRVGLQGTGGTGALVFWTGAVGGFLWRRYKRWRYPTRYG